MDAIDKEIVGLLLRDGRLTHEQISRQVGLSRPAVHDRIRRLESAGVVQGYTARVDWESLGLPVTAFVFVRVSGSCLPSAQAIYDLSCETAVVERCDRVAGDWCLLVHTRSASTHALQDLLDGIRSVPGVQGTMTSIALSTVVSDRALAPLAGSVR